MRQEQFINMFFLILFFCLFIFLYVIYLLSKDDYVFMRKSIAIEQVFNITFISILCGLFFARLHFVFLHPSWKYLQPLVFIVFFYFPGLSLTGEILGFMLLAFLLAKRTKIPMGKVFDIFALAFSISYSVGLLSLSIMQLIISRRIDIFSVITAIIFLLIFIALRYVYSKQISNNGLIANSILLIYTIVAIATNILTLHYKNLSFFFRDNILLLIFSLICFIVLIKHTNIQIFQSKK